ncbi:unnamed protein product [Malus baccata var. baccata]
MLRSFQAFSQIGSHIGSSILCSFPFPIAFWQLHCGFSTEAEHEPNSTKQPSPCSTKLYCTALLPPCVPMAYKLLFIIRFL